MFIRQESCYRFKVSQLLKISVFCYWAIFSVCAQAFEEGESTLYTSSYIREQLAQLGASVNINARMLQAPNPFLSTTKTNPIQLENALPGTSDWAANYAENREIEAYASLTSVNKGGQIKFFVNTKSPTYKIEIFRLGWYGGLGARKMQEVSGLVGTDQSLVVPAPVEVSGFDANWVNPYMVNIPQNWTTGIYLAKLTAVDSSKQTQVPFVVRDDNGKAEYLFQSSVTTYQAYNNWGGKSLYGYNSVGGTPATQVSFNRPYQGSSPGDLLAYEIYMLRFMEKEGYDVGYSTDIDTHENYNALLSHKAFLSVGHDEYWTLEMRNTVEHGWDNGIGIGFIGANAIYWQIRLEADANNVPNRLMVGYKEQYKNDPILHDNTPYNDGKATGLWRSSEVDAPEDGFIGVMFNGYPVGDSTPDLTDDDVVVTNTKHWVYWDTGLMDGDHLPGLLGYETDAIFGNGDQQPYLTVLAESPILPSSMNWLPPACARCKANVSHMTIYTAKTGASVYAAGTLQWAWGLNTFWINRESGPVKQATRNILARLANVPKHTFAVGVSELQTVSAAGGLSSSAKQLITSAINALQRAVASTAWLDAYVFTDIAAGRNVFDDQIAAVTSLTTISKPSLQIKGIRASLIYAGRGVAETAIAQANQGLGSMPAANAALAKKQLTSAQQYFDKANVSLSKGSFVEAATNFKNAWLYARYAATS